MKFDTPRCPECGELAYGTLEVINGVAILSFSDDNHAEYEGETRVDWNTQRTVKHGDGRAFLVCENWHEWLSSKELEEGESG